MGYQKALEKAGATVHVFDSFGSYQGDWWAKVTYQGKTGWVHGWFGSCSGCDSFQAEFDFEHHSHEDNDWVDPIYSDSDFLEGCPECESIMKRLAEFGRSYLDDLYTQEQAEKEAGQHADWDVEAESMVAFIKANAIQKG